MPKNSLIPSVIRNINTNYIYNLEAPDGYIYTQSCFIKHIATSANNTILCSVFPKGVVFEMHVNINSQTCKTSSSHIIWQTLYLWATACLSSQSYIRLRYFPILKT